MGGSFNQPSSREPSAFSRERVGEAMLGPARGTPQRRWVRRPPSTPSSARVLATTGRNASASAIPGTEEDRPRPRRRTAIVRDRETRGTSSRVQHARGGGLGRGGGERARSVVEDVKVVGGKRHIVGDEDGRADRLPGALAGPCSNGRGARRRARPPHRRQPVLDPVEARLDLVREHVAEPEHQHRAQRRGEEVRQEQLQRRELQDAGRQVGRRPEPDGEPAQDQDLKPVAVEIPLDLGLAGRVRNFRVSGRLITFSP